jgi:uncharacterized lipoprotein YajG
LTRISRIKKSKAVSVIIVCSIFLFMVTGCKYTDKTLKTTPYDMAAPANMVIAGTKP